MLQRIWIVYFTNQTSLTWILENVYMTMRKKNIGYWHGVKWSISINLERINGWRICLRRKKNEQWYITAILLQLIWWAHSEKNVCIVFWKDSRSTCLYSTSTFFSVHFFELKHWQFLYSCFEHSKTLEKDRSILLAFMFGLTWKEKIYKTRIAIIRPC